MNKKSQSGQALPLGLVLCVMGIATALFVFNTGQLASDKMRLASAADAAAYSGALWQARSLNYLAYTNRAMMANQVSVAQAVSLQSWVRYAAVTSDNIATVVSPLPIANTISRGVQTAVSTADRAMRPVLVALLNLSDTAIDALSLAQRAMHVATAPATLDVINAVISHSDPRFTSGTQYNAVQMAINTGRWFKFTEGYRPKTLSALSQKRHQEAVDERQRMIMASLDPFSRGRYPGYFGNIYVGPIRYRLDREGETKLVRIDQPSGPTWQWVSKDTLSLHTRKLFKKTELPIGWAKAQASSARSGNVASAGNCGFFIMNPDHCERMLDHNKKAERLSDQGLVSLSGRKTFDNLPGYGGLRRWRDLSASTIEADKQVLSIGVEVRLPAASITTSDTTGVSGVFAASGSLPVQSLSSLSAAEVFYQSPEYYEKAPDERAKPNAYNPFWQARLSNVSRVDRAAAFAFNQ